MLFKNGSSELNNSSELKEYLSPLGAWAFSVGTSIGWGSFVITSNTYLAGAGPLGSVLGLLAGTVVMLIIGRNYRYMIGLYRSAGGAYSYAKEAFGHDYGFITAWFLTLTYMAMFWANASSLPLFFRYFLNDTLMVGPHYTIFGYTVYIAEAMISVIAILLSALLCAKSKKITEIIMIFLALSFTVEIAFCLYAVLSDGGLSEISTAPLFAPGDKAGNPLLQILKIALMSPWAFIGFESISNSAQEFSFPRKKTGGIFTVSLVTTFLLYAFVIILSVSARPGGYRNWFEYISDLGKIGGIKGLPAFFAAESRLGGFGVRILLFALFALIVTSLIGNIVAVSRLLFSLSKDSMIDKRFSSVTKNGIPVRAVFAIAAVSAVFPFLGRTAIGWIVDVTTIGATIIYGFLSWAAWSVARKERKAREIRTGFLGMVLMIAFGVFLILPNLFWESAIARESYFLFIAWSILGILFFHSILKRDKEGHYGQSIVVWIVLLALILCMALIWMAKTNKAATDDALMKINLYIERLKENSDVQNFANAPSYMRGALSKIQISHLQSALVVVGLFVLSIGMLANNIMIMRKRDSEQREELGKMRALADRDSLTGVKSRRAYIEYEDQLNKRIEAAAPDDRMEFAVVVCDVNGLKTVNDMQGHKAGDEWIRAACSAICAHFKHSPVFRIGGDEFTAVLMGQDYDHRSEIMTELASFSERNKTLGRVVVAAGLSEFERGKDTRVASVFDRADNLMYENKKALKKPAKKSDSGNIQ